MTDSFTPELVAERLGITPDRLVVVGDTLVVMPGTRGPDGALLHGEAVRDVLGGEVTVAPVALAYAKDPCSVSIDADPKLGAEFTEEAQLRYRRALRRFAEGLRALLASRGVVADSMVDVPATALLGLFQIVEPRLIEQARQVDLLGSRLSLWRTRRIANGASPLLLPDPRMVKAKVFAKHNQSVTPISAPASTASTYTPVSRAYLADQAALEREVGEFMPSYGDDVATLSRDLRAAAPGFSLSGIEHDYFGLEGTDVELVYADEEDLVEDEAGDTLGVDDRAARLGLRRVARRLADRMGATGPSLDSVEARIAAPGGTYGALLSVPTRAVLVARAKVLGHRAELGAILRYSPVSQAHLRLRHARAKGRAVGFSRSIPWARLRRAEMKIAARIARRGLRPSLLRRRAFLQGVRDGILARRGSRFGADDLRRPVPMARALNRRRTRLLHVLKNQERKGEDTAATWSKIAEIDAKLTASAPSGGLDASRLRLRSPKAAGPVIFAVGIRLRPAQMGATSSHRDISQGYSALLAMDSIRRGTDLSDWVSGSKADAPFPLGGESPLPPPRHTGPEVWG